MKQESDVQQEVQIAARELGTTLMRNNSGAFQTTENGKPGRWVRYGLGHTSKNQKFKSSDLVGITPVTITPMMVGMTVGVFTAVEVKDESWNPEKKLDAHETEQKNFLDWVRSMGGIAGFVNGVDSLRKLLRP